MDRSFKNQAGEEAMTQSPDAQALAEISGRMHPLGMFANLTGTQSLVLLPTFVVKEINDLIAMVARLMETQRTPNTKEVCTWCSEGPVGDVCYSKRLMSGGTYGEDPACPFMSLRPATPRAGEGG